MYTIPPIIAEGILDNNKHDETVQEYDEFKKHNININSVLPKLEELKLIASKSNAAVIGISESKIDETVLNSEIQIKFQVYFIFSSIK